RCGNITEKGKAKWNAGLYLCSCQHRATDLAGGWQDIVTHNYWGQVTLATETSRVGHNLA
ncbi:MAG: hypothetical protein V3V23_07810, partial [Dehalococcoidales bacterium]